MTAATEGLLLNVVDHFTTYSSIKLKTEIEILITEAVVDSPYPVRVHIAQVLSNRGSEWFTTSIIYNLPIGIFYKSRSIQFINPVTYFKKCVQCIYPGIKRSVFFFKC